MLEASSRAEVLAQLEISSKGPARARLARLARDCLKPFCNTSIGYLVACKIDASALNLTLCMLHIVRRYLALSDACYSRLVMMHAGAFINTSCSDIERTDTIILWPQLVC